MAEFNVTTAGTGANPTVYNSGGNAGYQATNYADLASSLGSVVNAYQASKLKSMAAKHNAVMMGYEKYWVDKKTNQEIDDLYDDEARLLGNARAIAGGSGFSVSSETNKDIEKDIMHEVGKDATVIRANGGMENMKLDSKIGGYNLDAKNAKTEGALNMATSLNQTTNSKGYTNLFK